MGVTVEQLVEYLHTEFGDGLGVVVEFSRDSSEVRYGEEFFEEFVADLGARTREMMHRDAVSRLEMANLGEDVYDSTVRSEVRVTDEGTGVHFFLGDDAGVFVWLDDDVDFPVRSLVDECLARLDGE